MNLKLSDWDWLNAALGVLFLYRGIRDLYNGTGGFSSMGMSRRAMKTYEKGMRFEDVHENQYPFGK